MSILFRRFSAHYTNTLSFMQVIFIMCNFTDPMLGFGDTRMNKLTATAIKEP